MDKVARLRDIVAKMKEMNAAGNVDQAKWDELQKEAAQLKADIAAEEERRRSLEELDGFVNEAPEPASGRPGVRAPLTPKDKNERPFNTLGEQLQAVARLSGREDVNYPVDQAENRMKAVNAAAGVSTTLSGEVGFLIQTDFATTLRESAVEEGQLSSRVDRQPIGPNSDSFEYMEAKDKDRSKGPWGGAFAVFRKGEAEPMTGGKTAAMEPRDVRLEDMYGLLYVTNRSLRDATALTALIQRGYRANFAFKLDAEIYEGTGAGQCLGFMNSPALVTVAKESGQAADTIVKENILKMFYSMPSRYVQRAVWLVSQVGVQEALPLLMLGDVPIYIPPTGLSGGLYGTLLGRPIIPCERCPQIGDKGDIIFADLSQYLLIEKGATEIETSIHVKFVTDETAFRFIQRNNGQPWDSSPYTTLKGNKKMSPFVCLAERA